MTPFTGGDIHPVSGNARYHDGAASIPLLPLKDTSADAAQEASGRAVEPKKSPATRMLDVLLYTVQRRSTTRTDKSGA